MGTCLDWHTQIVRTLPARLDPKSRSALAIAWRESFFKDIHDQFEKKLPAEDIDATHARLLKALLSEQDFQECALSLHEQETAVDAWHRMTAWADIPPALSRLREKYEVFILANGTTRLQLDLARSSGLRYDMLFSSQLLMLKKPDPEIY
jgi:FMN phosphatase YigB (HAD superfamily)